MSDYNLGDIVSAEYINDDGEYFFVNGPLINRLSFGEYDWEIRDLDTERTDIIKDSEIIELSPKERYQDMVL